MRARWTGIPLIISDFFTDPGESDSVFRKVSTQSCLSEQADMANIDSSDDLGTTTIVFLILFNFLASLTVWARFWSRSTKKMSPGADDYVVLTGLVGLPMLFSVTSTVAYHCFLSGLFVGYRYFEHCGLHFGGIRSAYAVCDEQGASRCSKSKPDSK